MSAQITVAEVLDALALSSSSAPDDARTVLELVEATGFSAKRIREGLSRLQRDGRLVLHHVVRARIDGIRTLVPAYTVTPLEPQQPTRNRAG